jgi:hypothetical protein
MKKLTLRAMISLARKRRGRCLSTFYVNSTTPLVWQCSAGHQWSAVPASVRKGTWCPDCAGVGRITLNQMRAIAALRGGIVFPSSAQTVRQNCDGVVPRATSGVRHRFRSNVATGAHSALAQFVPHCLTCNERPLSEVGNISRVNP